jgi:hypothetical protein
LSCLAQLCWLQLELEAGDWREEMVQVERDATVFRVKRGELVFTPVAEAVAALDLQPPLLLALLVLLVAVKSAPPLHEWR